MKLSRATIALYVGLVFASGGVLGFFANRLYSATTGTGWSFITKTASAKTNPPTPEEFRKWLTGEYQKRLQLTDTQVQQMEVILDESQAQVKSIHAQMDPQLDAVRANQVTRMNLMLTPSQQTEYEKMRKERQERQKQERQKRGPRPGGPGF
jgi:predicted thioredoxin/glutaredoxin